MPWKDHGKNGSGPSNSGPNNGDGEDSPWRRSGSQSRQGASDDIEAHMRKLKQRFSRRNNGGGTGKGASGMGPGGFALLGGLVVAAWLATGIVIVDEGERAAIFRFGEYQKNFTPGLHIHMPAPIETHEILPSERQQETKIGASPDEALMLTGDENIVEVQFRVFWYYDTQNPQNFILEVDNGAPLVKAAAESVMREVVGKSDLDDVLTTGRSEIAVIVKQQLQDLLNDYQAGVNVENVEIQEALAPALVREAFIDVVNAGQDAERAVQLANRYTNNIVPRARGEAQRILQDAQAYRDRVIADANGQADRFIQILNEYRKAPQVTRERMYLETMERVLARADKLILDSDSGAVPYLPLDRVNRQTERN